MTVGAVILAAGQSRRFGSDKRVHLLAATVAVYQAAFEEVRLVLRPTDTDLLSQLDITLRSGDDVVRAQDAHLGMGHSLSAGVEGLADKGWQSLVIALGDMPYVREATLRLLIERLAAATPPTIVRPVYTGTGVGNGEAGQPVGFTADYLPKLATLTGDAGARALIREANTALITLETDDTGVLIDVDRPELLR